MTKRLPAIRKFMDPCPNNDHHQEHQHDDEDTDTILDSLIRGSAMSDVHDAASAIEQMESSEDDSFSASQNAEESSSSSKNGAGIQSTEGFNIGEHCQSFASGSGMVPDNINNSEMRGAQNVAAVEGVPSGPNAGGNRMTHALQPAPYYPMSQVNQTLSQTGISHVSDVTIGMALADHSFRGTTAQLGAQETTSRKKMLMREWLMDKLDKEEFPGLQYIDKSQGLFRVLWKHGHIKKRTPQDIAHFRAWADYGKCKGTTPRAWKEAFRNAIRHLPGVRKIEEGKSETASERDKNEPRYNVYQLTSLEPKPTRNPNRKLRRRSKGSTGSATSESAASPPTPMEDDHTAPPSFGTGDAGSSTPSTTTYVPPSPLPPLNIQSSTASSAGACTFTSHTIVSESQIPIRAKNSSSASASASAPEMNSMLHDSSSTDSTQSSVNTYDVYSQHHIQQSPEEQLGMQPPSTSSVLMPLDLLTNAHYDQMQSYTNMTAIQGYSSAVRPQMSTIQQLQPSSEMQNCETTEAMQDLSLSSPIPTTQEFAYVPATHTMQAQSSVIGDIGTGLQELLPFVTDVEHAMQIQHLITQGQLSGSSDHADHIFTEILQSTPSQEVFQMMDAKSVLSPNNTEFQSDSSLTSSVSSTAQPVGTPSMATPVFVSSVSSVGQSDPARSAGGEAQASSVPCYTTSALVHSQPQDESVLYDSSSCDTESTQPSPATSGTGDMREVQLGDSNSSTINKASFEELLKANT